MIPGRSRKNAISTTSRIITKLFPSNNTGIVRIESGREIPFSYQFVILAGEARTIHDLREGEEIGYDLGWTSSGLRITKIKTYQRTRAVENGRDVRASICRPGNLSDKHPQQSDIEKTCRRHGVRDHERAPNHPPKTITGPLAR